MTECCLLPELEGPLYYMDNPKNTNPWQRGTKPGGSKWTPTDWGKVMRPQIEPALLHQHEEIKKVKKNKGKKRALWWAKKKGWICDDAQEQAGDAGNPQDIVYY